MTSSYSGLDRLNTGFHWLFLVCAEHSCCQAQTLTVLNYQATLFWLNSADNPDITSSFTDIYATYIPLKAPDGNSSSCCCSCYSHKVPTANVAGKQRSTNLQREKAKIGSYIHGTFLKNPLHLAHWTPAYLWWWWWWWEWLTTSLITSRTPTYYSHWNQSLQPSDIQ